MTLNDFDLFQKIVHQICIKNCYDQKIVCIDVLFQTVPNTSIKRDTPI